MASSSSSSSSNNGEGAFEELVGITEYTNTAPGFRGILKQRYSDFIVREIGLDNVPSSLLSTNAVALERKHFGGDSSIGGGVEGLDEDEVVARVIAEIGEVSNGVYGAGALLSSGGGGPPAAAAAASSSSSSSGGGGNSGSTSDDCKALLAVFLKQCLGKSEDCAVYFTACPCSDKESRTKVHQIIRKYLPNAVDSEALEVKGNKFIRLVAKHRLKKTGKQTDNRNNSRAPQWPAGLGDFLQFTLLKENVDTMSAASVLSRHLHMRTDAIKYAGTKDKRAVTSQRCTVYRKRPADLSRMNRFNNAPIIRLGDFAYVTQALKLGALRGNHFSIVLRDVDVQPRTVAQACDAMQATGFINYFGLQRFGRGGSKSHEVGRALLRSEWKLAVHLLFTPREGDRPEIAEAKRLFGHKDYRGALKSIPAQLHSETCVLESLASKPEDYLNAFNRIAKNPRLICIHAYQSYVWNLAASERVRRHGLVCVVGDLVLEADTTEAASLLDAADDVLEDGDDGSGGGGGGGADDVAAAAAAASAGKDDDAAVQSSKVRLKVRPLTADDIAAGTHTIRDVLLPLPGYDSVFPANEIGQFYADLLAKDGISSETFSTCYVQYRSAGAYRRLIQMPGDFQWSCFAYVDPNAELMPTELTYLRKGADATTEVPPSFALQAMPTAEILCGSRHHADTDAAGGDAVDFQRTQTRLMGVLLKFTLPPGTYATMMLREVTKQGTDSQFQAGLTAQAAADAGAGSSSSGSGSGSGSGGDAEEIKVASELLAMSGAATAAEEKNEESTDGPALRSSKRQKRR